jgi:hypothetical protein
MPNPPLTRRLETLRAGLRLRWLAAGGLRLVAEVAGFLVLQFAVDRLLWLPVGARQFAGLAAGALFAWRLFRLVIRPLRKSVTVHDVALVVERRHPGLQGGLASMVEVEAAGRLPADNSPELLEQWRAAVATRAAALDFGLIFAPALLRRLALLAGAGVLLIGGFAAFSPHESAIFLARLVGADVAWPRRTRLELDVAAAGSSMHFRVERDDDQLARRVVVARGASLPIVVRARGAVPDEVLLLVREEGRVGAEEVRMARRDGTDDDFIHRFGNATRPLRLTAAGGDDPGQGPPLEVEVIAPPAIDRLVATTTPPAYTGRPTVREERHEFAVPVGTTIDLELATSGDVVEASLTLHSDPGTARPLVADERTPGLWRGSVVAEESGTLNFQLTGRSGFRNLRPIDVPLTVLADRKSSVEIVRPAVSDLEVTARAVVALRLLVDDDYGVRRSELSLVRSDDPAVSSLLLQGEGSARPALLPAQGEPHALDAVLDLATLELPRAGVAALVREGDSLVYSARIEDNRTDADGAPAPQVTVSPTRRIDVIADSEKLRKLGERQQRVKAAVAAARKSQEERKAGLEALLSAQGDGGIATRELTVLEVEQGRVGNSVRQSVRDLCDVTAEFTLNRLDPAQSAERAVQRLLSELAATRSGPNFDFSPFRALTVAHGAGEFGDLQPLGALLQMTALGLAAAEDLAPKALDQLRQARLTGVPEERLERLRGAELAQRQLIETLTLLLQKMEEWEDFHEILDLWRGLVDDQKELNERARRNAAPAGGSPPAGGAPASGDGR